MTTLSGQNTCIGQSDQAGTTKTKADPICAAKGESGRICTLAEIQAGVTAGIVSSSGTYGTSSGKGCCCPCGTWAGVPQTWYEKGGTKCECWTEAGNTHHPAPKYRCCTDL